ncbi:MAG: hypothetical protein R3E77_11260 [Steroidobacteraceae bacterium]
MTMCKRILVWFVPCCIVVAGCAAAPPKTETSLQVQAYQAREFEVEKGIAFAAVISVFQDLGYIVQSADKETGFITASSPSGNRTSFWEALGGVSSHGQTKATAFIEEIRTGFASIRLNFVNTKSTSSLYGQQSQNDTIVADPKAYQIAFEKIGDAIFIRSGGKSN